MGTVGEEKGRVLLESWRGRVSSCRRFSCFICTSGVDHSAARELVGHLLPDPTDSKLQPASAPSTSEVSSFLPMWVMEKMRLSMESSHLPVPAAQFSFKIGDVMFGDKAEKPRRISLNCPNVITPNNIPAFCIPPTIPPPPEPGRAAGWRPEAEELLGRHVIQVESVDESGGEGGSDEESTNADPQSQAALSLPHLAKAQTCYGFCTLLESPHTRRKESLFHAQPGVSPLLLPRSRSNPSSSSSSSSRLSPRGRSLNWPSAPESDTTSSAESSPFGSPLLSRCPAKSSLFKTLSHELLLSRNTRRAAVSRNNSLSTDEGSSTDNSPNVMRRASEGRAGGLPAGYGLAPPALFPLELSLPRERAMKERTLPLGKDGSLRLAAEYCPDNRRLRVRLVSSEGLYPPSVDPKVISCSVSLCLTPGKAQKQRSTVIRKSRNPVFNEDFFFDGISQEELGQRSLRFKVVNKMSSLKRDFLLGDADLPLASILT